MRVKRENMSEAGDCLREIRLVDAAIRSIVLADGELHFDPKVDMPVLTRMQVYLEAGLAGFKRRLPAKPLI